MIQQVTLSKEDKLKKLNDKLNMMMQKKNVDLQKVQKKNQKTTQKVDPYNVSKKTQQSNQKTQKTEKKKNIIQQKRQQQLQAIKKHKMIKKQQREKAKKVLRKAAGTVWKDQTMQDWPDNDYRIFVGNLGNQVGDAMLGNVFKKYQSFQMAKVISDKRTGKSRGYGFVSFSQPKDFLNALKQMNGAFVGNRPVKVMKSNWKDRCIDSEKNQSMPSDFKSNNL